MNFYWCDLCGGEAASCECEEIIENDDDDFFVEPDDDSGEVRDVRWVPGDNGPGHLEVIW